MPVAKTSKENRGGAEVHVVPARVAACVLEPIPPPPPTAGRRAQVSISCCGAACPGEKAEQDAASALCSVHRLAAGAGALFIIQFS